LPWRSLKSEESKKEKERKGGGRERGEKEENVVHIHNGVLFSHEEARNHVVCREMDGTGNCHV
jgi:hypothetical protein